jgi:hypothetical protein
VKSRRARWLVRVLVVLLGALVIWDLLLAAYLTTLAWGLKRWRDQRRARKDGVQMPASLIGSQVFQIKFGDNKVERDGNGNPINALG